MRKTRKLHIRNFTKCHPKMTQKNKCLPSYIYSTKTNCKVDDEHCLLDNAQIDDNEKKELRKRLRPRRPKAWDSDPDMWLDNYNINAVMKQYEEAYKWFKFLGIFPIDFSAPDPYTKNNKCLHREVCELNLKNEYSKGNYGIGMIFNLDPHFKGGSHWVALYININNIEKPIISYFDSYGYKTPALIGRLMRSFKLQNNNCELGFNKRRFQYGNSECGMFSMYFIICMLSGITFKNFCKDSISDSFMLQLRKILFSK